MKPVSIALPEFWESYDALSPEVQNRADKQYARFALNPSHPSLRFKQVGRYWSARVDRGHRALAVKRDGVYYWFWIGPHDEYETLIAG